MGKNVPLLLRMVNDVIVEENPGPTIYDVVDSSKTMCALSKKFRQNDGKQCVAMSLTGIIYNKININAWDSSFLNVIL